MKKIITPFILIALVIIAFTLLKNGIFQSVVSGAVSKATHVPVHIGGTNVSLIHTTIDLKNIRVNNPRSFPDKIMLDAPQIYINFDLPALFKGYAHFRDVKLDLKEFVVVKNAKGELNVDALKPKESEKQESKKNKSEGKMPKLKIDRLSLTIGRVVYKDYSQGNQPSVQTFDINIKDRQYNNIDNIPGLVSLITFEALTRTSLSRLAGLDIGSFKSEASSLLGDSFGLVTDKANGLGDTAKGLLNLFK